MENPFQTWKIYFTKMENLFMETIIIFQTWKIHSKYGKCIRGNPFIIFQTRKNFFPNTDLIMFKRTRSVWRHQTETSRYFSLLPSLVGVSNLSSRFPNGKIFMKIGLGATVCCVDEYSAENIDNVASNNLEGTKLKFLEISVCCLLLHRRQISPTWKILLQHGKNFPNMQNPFQMWKMHSWNSN